MRRAGFVLVGGKSARMGRDKALLSFRNTTLAGSVAERVRAAAGNVRLVGDPVKYATLGYPVIGDRNRGCGPMGGLEAILEGSFAEWNLMVACDLPFVPEEYLRLLLTTADQLERVEQACVSAVSSRGLEPLCAVYHATCLPQVSSAIATGQFRMRSLIARLSATAVPVTDESFFININTPLELAGIGGGDL